MTETSRPARSPSRFVVVEGANGSGKTSVAQALAAQLRSRKTQPVHETREPSDTPLGRAIRELEASMPSRALALACAADRVDHLTREIEPKLTLGTMVICDRFLPSSLVLQRLDGLSLEEIWQLNEGLRSPDIMVYLEAAPETLRERLTKRPRRSRFEESAKSEVELEFYRDARAFLSERGWPGSVINTEGRSAEQVAAEIALWL